jgi:hypothetical protein
MDVRGIGIAFDPHAGASRVSNMPCDSRPPRPDEGGMMHLSKDKPPSNESTIESTRPAAPPPIYVAIPVAPAAAAAEAPPGQTIEPGQLGQAAVTAAAQHQLDRYAEEVQEYLASSQMDTLVNRIQAELDKDDPAKRPRLRLRRD